MQRSYFNYLSKKQNCNCSNFCAALLARFSSALRFVVDNSCGNRAPAQRVHRSAAAKTRTKQKSLVLLMGPGINLAMLTRTRARNHFREAFSRTAGYRIVDRCAAEVV